jgi:F-type H+-transporting ATPase subunit epsilon
MPLHFELVSPEKLLSSGSVYMVVAPGSEGDFGVLEGHAPFMSTIRPGVITVYETEGASPARIFINGGFAEVNEKGLTILAEEATAVGDLSAEDIARKIAAAREDVKLAKNDGERTQAEKMLESLEAMQAALVN